MKEKLRRMIEQKKRENEMDKKYRVFFKVAAFAVVFMVVLFTVSRLFERKASRNAKGEFYVAKENYDVWFMGTSRMLNSAFPMELWNEYGITSYNLSGHAQFLPVTYWVMREALENKTPKVIVMDVMSIGAGDKVYTADMAYLHHSLDVMPFSPTKCEAVFDLLPEQDDRVEFLCNLSIYHSRWEEIGVGDFKPELSKEKGAEARIHVNPVEAPALISEGNIDETETMGKEYLRRIIALCKEKNVKLLLANLPQSADEDSQRMYASASVFADGENVDFINYLTRDKIGVIDYATDMFDNESHLNPSGARKVTRDLGKYLVEHYNLPDHRRADGALSEGLITKWNQDYQVYRQYLMEIMEGTDCVDDILMLAADPSIEINVSVGENSQFLEGEFYKALFANLEKEAKSFEIVTDTGLGREQIKLQVRDTCMEQSSVVEREF